MATCEIGHIIYTYRDIYTLYSVILYYIILYYIIYIGTPHTMYNIKKHRKQKIMKFLYNHHHNLEDEKCLSVHDHNFRSFSCFPYIYILLHI